MILINLLPREYRQKKRAPLKFLAVVSGAAAVNASLLAFWAWTAFGVSAEVDSELQVLRDTEQGLQPQVAYHKDLVAESAVFDSREATLKNVTDSRVSWTREMDHMVDLINRGGEGDKYLIWLDGVTVDTKENARSNSWGTFKAAAHSGTNNFTHVANFLDDVEHSELAKSFSPPEPPTGQAATTDEDYEPSEIWNFPLEMKLKAPEERGESK